MNENKTGFLIETKITLKRQGTGSTIVLDQQFIFNAPINVGRNKDWAYLGTVATAHFREMMPGWDIVDAKVVNGDCD